MYKFFILWLTTLLVGAGALPTLAADEVHIEQIKALNIKPAPGKALIYLYRAGSELDNYKLYFDDQKITALFAKSFIVIETEPGRHLLAARPTANRSSASKELYTFEAGQTYFIENKIGVDITYGAYNVPISEFWKRKESHWLKVRDSLSFLDFVGSTSPRETMLAETPPAATQSQTASPPPPVAAIPVIAVSSPPAKPAPAAPTPAIASPKPIVAAAPAPPASSKPVAAPAAATAPAPTPVVATAPAPVHVPAPPAVKPAAAIAAVPPVAIVTPAPAVPPAATPVAAPAPRKPMQNPTGIAVIIGNRNYSKNNRDLPDVDYALNDAQAMYDYVRTTLGYREGNIIYLKDATQAQLLSVFGIPGDPEGKLFNWVRPKQSDVFVYYSGHGVPGARDGRSYLLPVDADPTTVQINGYLLETLYANLAAIPAKSVTVVLDACFSGGSAGGAVFQKASSITLRTVDTPALLPNGTIFSATGQNEVASWDQDAKLGLFTRAYLEGLKGAADGQGFGNSDGNVTLAELKGFLEEEVAYAARRNYGRKQTPQVSGQGELIMATLP